MGNGKDKVKFRYYSFRVEFQARGLPHIHGVAWICPEYLKELGITSLQSWKTAEEKKNIIKLVNDLITCKIPTDDPALKEKVEQLHIHVCYVSIDIVLLSIFFCNGRTRNCIKTKHVVKYGKRRTGRTTNNRQIRVDSTHCRTRQTTIIEAAASERSLF